MRYAGQHLERQLRIKTTRQSQIKKNEEFDITFAQRRTEKEIRWKRPWLVDLQGTYCPTIPDFPSEGTRKIK
jgi:hypothetical protein